MAGSGCNAYQIRKIYAIGGALGMVKRNEEDDLLHELVEGMTGKKSIKALTYGEAARSSASWRGGKERPAPQKRKAAPQDRTGPHQRGAAAQGLGAHVSAAGCQPQQGPAR